MNTSIFKESTEKHFTEKIDKIANDEKVKEYRKQYYIKNQAKWKEHYAQKNFNLYIDCELCKSSVKKRHIQEHIKTKKHQKLYSDYLRLQEPYEGVVADCPIQ